MVAQTSVLICCLMRSIRCHWTDKSIALQGGLSQWTEAEHVSFSAPPLCGHPRGATVYTLWDARNLYLAFDVHSTKLQAEVRERDGDKLWMDDGIEFLIDAGRHRSKGFLPDDFAYHINILNTVYDDRGTPAGQPDPAWNGVAEHVVKILDDYRYVVEVAVPWDEIGIGPKPGSVLGIDFCVNSRHPVSGEYVYYDWCELRVFHDPSGFGELILL